MADAVAVFPPGFRVVDSNGDPLSGAQVRFFVAGTSTPKTVYSDEALSVPLGSIVYSRSDGYLVSAQGGSTTVMVFVGTADYKVDILDVDGATVYPAKDNVKGALDTSNFLTTGETSSLVIPVTAIATDTTLSAGNTGTLIHTTGAITITFPNPATVGNDWNVKIRCNDASNATKLVASAGTIKGPGFSVAFMALSGLGAEVEIVCDGANMILVNRMLGLPLENGRLFTFTSRVSSAPATTAGNWYLVSAGFGAFSTGDVIEATGNTTFIGYTPPSNSGWRGYVQGEGVYYHHVSSGWVAYEDQPEISTPGNPPATTLRIYAKGVGGVSHLMALNSAGLETDLTQAPAFASNLYATNADITTVMPYDDTIPQNTEGVQINSVSITAKRSTSSILVEWHGFGVSASGAAHVCAALFIDSGANAVNATVIRPDSVNHQFALVIRYVYTPGDVAAHTINVRVGPDVSGTIRMNGDGASRAFGGVAACVLTAREIYA